LSNRRINRRGGFTLIEIIVASVIGLFVALVAAGALQAVSAGARVVDESIDRAGEVQFAVDVIKRDLENFYRDNSEGKFVCRVEEGEGFVTSVLNFYTVGRVPARAGQPEGDIYEVEYYLAGEGEELSVFKRLRPNPDDQYDSSGILIRLADGIDFFSVRCFDGVEWVYEWPEEQRMFPELVEVSTGIAATGSEAKGKITSESFVVNFVKAGGTALGVDEEFDSSGVSSGEMQVD